MNPLHLVLHKSASPSDKSASPSDKSAAPSDKSASSSAPTSYTPPESVVSAAKRALAARAEASPSNKGGTSVGLATARLLASGRPVSLAKVRHIAAYFPRHEGDKSGETWASKGKGWQAWHLWGGDAGWAWARRIVERADRVEKSTVGVELPEALGEALWNTAPLEKAARHKYIRRVSTGNPKRPYRYYYRVTGGAGIGHDDEIKVGSAFRVKHGGKEGHFHVVGENADGTLQIKHDESGHEGPVDREALREMIHAEHAEAIGKAREKAAADLEQARKTGSPAQVKAREVEARGLGVDPSDEWAKKQLAKTRKFLTEQLTQVADETGWNLASVGDDGWVVESARSRVTIMRRSGKWFVEVGPTEDPAAHPGLHVGTVAYLLHGIDGNRAMGSREALRAAANFLRMNPQRKAEANKPSPSSGAEKGQTMAELADEFRAADRGPWYDGLKAAHALLLLDPDRMKESARMYDTPAPGRVMGQLAKRELQKFFEQRDGRLRGYYGAGEEHTPLEMWEQKVEGLRHLLEMTRERAEHPDAPWWADAAATRLQVALREVETQRSLFERVEAALPGARYAADHYRPAGGYIEEHLRQRGDDVAPTAKSLHLTIAKSAQPTQAQKQAGNYPKKRIRFAGLPITLEHEPGGVREGVDSSGKPWRTVMRHAYGYIRGTEGADGDQVDVFLGPSEDARNVYVVHQVDPDTDRYDEDKCMLGFDSEDDAVEAYRQHYDRPDDFVGEVSAMPLSVFKRLLRDGDGAEIVPGVRARLNRMAKSLQGGRRADRIPGGLADKKRPSDFDAKALAEGVAVEREHTSDPAIAEEIAMDHLAEDPEYYRKLRRIEGASKGPKGTKPPTRKSIHLFVCL